MATKKSPVVETLTGEWDELTTSGRASISKPEYLEFVVWGLAFLVFRLAVQSISHPEHFYRDEVTFTEGALRMAANRLSSGDYIHGPVINYVLLAAYALVAASKLLFRQIGSADDFVRWYISHPESLGQVSRLMMSLGGAALLVVTMLLARIILGSPKQARVAGGMLLSMPLFHHASWYVKEDLWAALFGTLAAVVAYRKKSAGWTGLLFGTAIAAKYTALALGPAILVVLMVGREGDWSRWKSWLEKSARLASATLLAFIALNPYIVFNFASFVRQIRMIDAQYIQGEFLGTGTAPPLLVSRVLLEFLPYDIGVLAIISVCAGFILICLRPGRRQLPPLLASVVIIAMLGASRAGFPRTLAIALPWLAILACVPYRLVLRSRFSKAALTTALGAVVLFQTAGYYRYVTAEYTGGLARAYVEESISTDAIVLMEDVHDYVADAAPALRRNIRALMTEQEDLKARGAAGKLNLMRQAIARGEPTARYEILGIKDFSTEGRDRIDSAHVVITCKWPSMFPENREFNLPEDSRVPAIGVYQQNRQLFIETLRGKGFHLLSRFDPTVPARWSFMDRPDPRVLSPMSWLSGGELMVGPEIAIYAR